MKARAWILIGICFAMVNFKPVMGQAKSARPAITGISHLVVLDDDMVAVQHFYGDVIGWPASKPLDQTNEVHYQVGLKQYIEVKKAPVHDPNDRVETIAFETADVRALRVYLASQGVVVPAKVDRHANGTMSILVHDPDGYRVEFDQGGKFPLPSPDAISTHLIHIGFDTRDEKAMRHFYLDVLGFKPYWHGWRKGDPEGIDDYQSIQVPDGHDWVELMVADGRNFPVGTPRNPHHFAPGVVSVEDAYILVQKRDPELAKKVHTQEGRDGKGQLNLFDPNHTRVEFMNFKPSAEPCCSAFTADSPDPQP
jgi:catechol 2,3-dioxygenase-like lactoylglutathione lyase family enzyme